MNDNRQHRDTGPGPDVTAEVCELRTAAWVAYNEPTDLGAAINELMKTAADRLEAHPKAQGGMTQAALRIARVLNGQAQS